MAAEYMMSLEMQRTYMQFGTQHNLSDPLFKFHSQ